MKRIIFTVFLSLLLIGTQFHGGYLFAQENKRQDYANGETISATDVIPANHNWRNYNGMNMVTPIKEQKCNDSWAFAAIAALESKLLIETQQTYDLSEQVLISDCFGNGNCQTGNIPKVSKFLVNTGAPLETCYPYLEGQNGLCTDACQGWQQETYKFSKRTSILKNVQALKEAVYNYGPVLAGMVVYDDFKQYKNGIYKCSSTTKVGGAAVLIVGYNDTKECFIAKNSWGTQWGQNGFFKIAYSEVTNKVKFGRQAYAFGNQIQPDPPPEPEKVINKGEPKTGLFGKKGAWDHFRLIVPQKATNLEIKASGGAGDLDLYVKFNEKASSGSYDCRPYQSGNNESCQIPEPQTGPYYLSMYGFEEYSGVTLTATYETENQPQEIELNNGKPMKNQAGKKNSWKYYWVNIPKGATNLVIETSGGSGDADMYTQFGRKPTKSSYKCRPYKNGNSEKCSDASPEIGTYFVGVLGYSAYSNLMVTARYNGAGPDPAIKVLKNNQVVNNINAISKNWKYFKLNVPPTAEKLQIQVSGGSGDVDLYTSFGKKPNIEKYNCRPYRIGNNEVCDFITPAQKECYIGLYAYEDFSGVKLKVRHTTQKYGDFEAEQTVFTMGVPRE